MKKTLTAAAMSSLLVLGLATSALAIHETETAEEPMVVKGPSKITVDGNVRLRGYYDSDNWNDDNTLGGPGRSGYDTRVQLGVMAKVSEQASGYIKLESGNTAANTGGNSDVYGWGNGMIGNDGLFTGGNKMGDLSILEAWVNYSPGVWGVKAGHMPLALGNKMFFDHTGSGDDALVFYANPLETTHIAALTIKFDEQTNAAFNPNSGLPPATDSSDDLDGYVLLATHKLNDALNLGANYTYLRGGSDSAIAIEAFPGLTMSNLGLTADGKIGAISYLADLEVQFGDVQDIDDLGSPFDTVDANGWAMKLGGNYDLGAGKIGLLFGYGSGDDAEEVADAIADNIVNGDNDMDHDGFINFLTDTTYDTIIAGYRSPIPGAASWAGAANATGRNTGLSNLTLYQLNGSTKVVCPLTGKDLSLFASASYMQLSEDTINGLEDDGDFSEVDGVGTEVDLIATWAVTAGLNYKVEAAYMWTGDVYDTENSTASGLDDEDGENLAFIRHSLDLKF